MQEVTFSCTNQGCSRVFESGTCAWPKTPSSAERSRLGKAREGKIPSRLEGLGELPGEKRILNATLCVLNASFAEFGTRFQSFWSRIHAWILDFFFFFFFFFFF